MHKISFKPKQIVSHIDEGEYTGIVKEVAYSEKNNRFWFKICVDNVLLNIYFSGNSIVFNNFALYFVDDEGNFDSESLIDTKIKFTTIDNIINDNIYSRITKISPLYD